MPNSESTLQPLADVLQASPESDALVILGRLLDSLPIAKATSPDHLYFSQVRARCGKSRAAFSVGRKFSAVPTTCFEDSVTRRSRRPVD